jgi:phage virion morphogenesis protein
MIEIKIDDRELQRTLHRLARRVSDLTPFFLEAEGILAESVDANFEAEGRPKWRPLAPSTIKQRAKRGHSPGPILAVRGDLARSITRHHDAHSAVVGTNKVYARIHQFGGWAGRGQRVVIQARPFLTLGDDERGELLAAMLRHLARG